MYTHLEDYIRELLSTIKVHSPPDLTIENVASKLKLEVVYRRKSYRFGNEIILQPGTEQQEWQLFGHELCHYLRHAGTQLLMHPLFIDLQEYQANYFAYHFCVPTFMLEQFKEVNHYEIMENFNVEEGFALRRIEMYERKMLLAWSRC
ncbi:ImmA/IrrE family metallo-endopeptidase [Oceanobacillus alkalisoli]|uniref:ImmA/IrrE family metallo-endopeptidase n=1 Tax=Oceanobacillus alkalisoli TaxID=2925113 RepID=UPI001EF03F34|nr:ImmA/IrrE family metallo-endopeptidase [Oceanobacillus alkalisoli]MCF3942161.1 ImmA/IrrE family metallo-endopeptidase [Oceanobacillus alkalisoli]MCG5104395.1 ImmA/IrrE family metallo-endopeptidase [Oceanobacillus alkalisoli]